MKKTLLIGSALVIGFAGFSQNNNRSLTPGNPNLYQKTSAKDRLKTKTEPANYTPDPNAQRTVIKPSSPNAACTPAANKFTTAVNCFAVGGGGNTSNQNCLSYNKDLNAVIWSTRISNAWKTLISATSGAQQATFLYVAPNKWDSTLTYVDASTNTAAGRYPGGTFLANPGDTAVSHAFAVGSGPITAGTGWTAEWYNARALSGGETGLHTPPAMDTYSTNIYGGLFGTVSSGFLDLDMQQLDGGKKVFVSGALLDEKVTATNAGTTSGSAFGIATISGSSAPYTVTWSKDSLKPHFYKGVLGYGNNSEGARIAFGPDGMTGYAVFIGRLATTFGTSADSMYAPVVYKTMDAGVTWDSVLFGYNWTCKHPECMKNVLGYADSAKYKNINKHAFNFSGSQGMDLTVDKNNVLHFVSTVEPASSYIDSLGFTFSYYYDYGQWAALPYKAGQVRSNTWPYIWDFMTDGTTAFGWKTMLVDSILAGSCSSTATDTTSSHSAFTDGTSTGKLPVNSHITVSRATDGSAVFYGWADVDPSSNSSVWNNVPDVFIKGYNITSGMVSAKTDFTNLGTCYYPYLATESYYDNAQSAWVVPMVWGVGSIIASTSPQVTYNGTSPMNFYYNNCGVFGASAFTTNAIVYDGPSGSTCGIHVGIKSLENPFASSISNYPNPFDNTTTIAVTLTESKAVSIKVYNAMGALISTKNIEGNVGQNSVTFDGGQLSSGVYYYTVTAGNEQATKKMVIQK